MFILPSAPQSISQLLGKTLALAHVVFPRLFPFALVVALLDDAPEFCLWLLGHNMIDTPARFYAFMLIASTVSTLIYSIMIHQIWWIMHNRQREWDASTTYVYARLFRIAAIPVLLNLIIFAVLVSMHVVAEFFTGVLHVSFFWFYGVLFLGVIYYLLRLALTLPIVVIKDKALIDAFKQSWQLSHGAIHKLLLPLAVLLVLVIFIHTLVDLLSGHSLAVVALFDILLTTGFIVLLNSFMVLVFYDCVLAQGNKSTITQ